ncbi:cell well associated RhsD protein precursor [Flavobacteriales bacterium ALC-1]|nr:cell well associated RhsD protein precursor [Flavobacteriales bacterium ALC-1]
MKIYKNISVLNSPLLLVLFMCLGSSFGYAQNLTGSTNVQPNTTHTYTYNDGTIYTKDKWTVTNGTLISNSESGTTYTAVVQWGGVGSASVTFKNSATTIETLTVTVAQNQSSGLSNENYVYNVTPRIETTDVATLNSDEKIESVTYFDGLGRPMQQVAIEAGGNSEDIISFMDNYDDFGRQTKTYLPYTSSVAKGTYRTDALSATNTFYDASSYNDDFPGMTTADINPYSEKEFDNSPLNRVMKQAAPGKDWKMGNTHEIEMDYLTNTSSTEVRNYSVTLSKTVSNSVTTYTPNLVTSGYYGINELYKTVTKDENHDGTSSKAHTTEEFKDKQGRVILKRTYGTSKANGSIQTNVAHDTYYVYDNHGNLSFVLSPKAEPHSNKPDATELNELCYKYKYDDLGRLVEKKIPGKGWEYIVYNKLDQPILTQDSKLDSQNKWLFTKYDVFGRVAYTGYINNSSTRITLQNAANTVTTPHVTKQSSSISLAGTTIYYNNGGYPTSNIAEIYTINYYDNYTFDKASGNSETAYGVTPTTAVKGLATGSKVRILGTNNWITTVSYYDDKSRPIYVYSLNAYLHTTDKVKSDLTFDGRVIETTTTHAKTGHSTITTIDKFEYDDSNRLLTHKQKINSASLDEVITSNTYDSLGQLTDKGVGGKTNQSRLQDVNYDYNIRGWLKAINDPTSLGTDLFGFKINYNTVDHGGNALFNGNISETEWKTNNDNVQRWYIYTYDALNRITKAQDNTLNEDYRLENVVYDKNGNIMNLVRYGHKVPNPVAGTSSHFDKMDDLVYTYDTKSNKLKKVLDNGYDAYGFKDGTNATTEYTYDSNGNMITDDNKGIVEIQYNHLNLPTYLEIEAADEGNITYIYDATGVKLEKIAVENFGTTTTKTFYAGNYIYEKIGSATEVLKFFSHPEGYIEKDGSSFDYVYQFKDHLGNIRLTYADSDNNGSINSATEIISENNYYPFGLKHKGYNEGVSANVNSVAQKFRYNGMELEESLGVDWYEMDMRQYDPAIARWTAIDPVVHYSMSTYTAFDNNPVYWADPSGADSQVTWGSGFGPGLAEFRADDTGGDEDGECDYCVEGQSMTKNIFKGGGINSTNHTTTLYWHAGGVNGSKAGWLSEANYLKMLKPIAQMLGNAISGRTPALGNPDFGSTFPFIKFMTSRRSIGGLGELIQSMADDLNRASVRKRNYMASGHIAEDNMSTLAVFLPGLRALGSAVTTSEGFLLGSFTARTPWNIPVQRFGNMSLSRPDYWGLRLGSNKFINRTFAAIKPEWNPLTQYTTGIIPKGTSIRFGIIGPQGLSYPGGSIQFIQNSNKVINQASKIKY